MVTKGLADTLILIDQDAERAQAERLDLADAQGGLPLTPSCWSMTMMH
jgi:malate/lactate dehydrogenase